MQRGLSGLGLTAGLAAASGGGVSLYNFLQSGKGEDFKKSLSGAAHGLLSIITAPYEAGKAAGNGDFGPIKHLAADTALYSNPYTAIPTAAHDAWKAAMEGVVPAPPNAYQDRMKQEKKVGAGRGIAPPSSYRY
jgi:hypothetical protein